MKELSQSDIYSLLSTAIRQGGSASSLDSPWVRDVYDTYLVYSDTDGKLYQRSYEIDAVTEDVTLGDPVEVVQVTSYAPVARTSSFSLPSPATFSDQDTVTRRGPIFKAGTHNTAGGPYSMTEEELADAVANFSPVPVDLDHHKTVLDGKLGQVSSVELGEGGVLFGTVELPRWLDDALGDGARRVSCAWDRATKQLKRLALTDTPRLSEAALFSRYAEFAGARHSASDQADMQSIHDIAVKQGAGCTAAASYSHSNKEKTKMSLMDKIKQALAGATPDELAAFSAGDGDADGGTEHRPTPPTPTRRPHDLLRRLHRRPRSLRRSRSKTQICKLVSPSLRGSVASRRPRPPWTLSSGQASSSPQNGR
jgi:hypothetical protein